jgi:hypothetical protein
MALDGSQAPYQSSGGFAPPDDYTQSMQQGTPSYPPSYPNNPYMYNANMGMQNPNGFSNNGPFGDVGVQTLPPGNQLQQQYNSPGNQAIIQNSPYQAQLNQFGNAFQTLMGQQGYSMTPYAGTGALNAVTNQQILGMQGDLAMNNLQYGLKAQDMQSQYGKSAQADILRQQNANLQAARWAQDLVYAGQQKQLSGREAWQQAMYGQRQLEGQAGASGGMYGTLGQQYGGQQIQQTLANQVAQAGITYGHEYTLDKVREEVAQNQAQLYGMEAGQFKDELNNGLKQLGIEQFTNANDLMTKMSTGRLQDRIGVASVVHQAMQQSPSYSTSAPVGGLSPYTQQQIQGLQQGGYSFAPSSAK